ncbi:MAG: glycosyltransferase family 2 protein [Peptostreptococcaceae bacterium]|nr:glycosyltransferase family 2 protein [Peptostreptococcaceae bacterium]
MSPTLSIIVPAYKVEAYLENCINSILNQSYADFELILIDDGSPDKCGAICDAYAQSDERIKVIHKDGLSFIFFRALFSTVFFQLPTASYPLSLIWQHNAHEGPFSFLALY